MASSSSAASAVSSALQLRELTPATIALLTATYLSSIGALPEPPLVLQRLAKEEWFRYTMLWLLLYQSTGATGDISRASVVTAAVYFGTKLLNHLHSKLADATARAQKQQPEKL